MSLTQIRNIFGSPVTAVTTAETTIAVSGPYVYDEPPPYVGSSAGAGQGVNVSGVVQVSPVGTTASTATVRVRQGSITGPIVGNPWVIPVTPAATAVIPYSVNDTSRVPAQSGGVTYFITIAFAAATANSTITECTLTVLGT